MIKDRDVMKAVDLVINKFASLEDINDQLYIDNKRLTDEVDDLRNYVQELRKKIRKLEEDIIELQLTGKADESQK